MIPYESVPAVFEIYVDGSYIGYVELVYKGNNPWEAQLTDDVIDGRFSTAREAELALVEAWKKKREKEAS